MEQYPTEKLVYIDESGIDKFISREYGWGAKGAKVVGEISGRRYTRESFVAALHQKKSLLHFVIKELVTPPYLIFG